MTRRIASFEKLSATIVGSEDIPCQFVDHPRNTRHNETGQH